MKVSVEKINENVHSYKISNGQMNFSAVNFGCTITNVILNEEKSDSCDVVIGFDWIEDYENGYDSRGAVVGRVANRISGAKFVLDGKTYCLEKNFGSHCLHGGKPRYEKLLWKAETFENASEAGVIFSRTSPDGEQGFPGNLQMKIKYSLNEKNELFMEYEAVTDKPTPINLTNHSYFNLAGKGSVMTNRLQLNCERIVETGDFLIPTGKFLSVRGTPYDFIEAGVIQHNAEKSQNLSNDGFDVCYVTKALETGRVEYVGKLTETCSGRAMEIFTDQCGIQLYTGGILKGTKGKNGVCHIKNEGICFEAQMLPDSVNREEFPDCILKPGEVYKSRTIYKFIF